MGTIHRETHLRGRPRHARGDGQRDAPLRILHPKERVLCGQDPRHRSGILRRDQRPAHLQGRRQHHAAGGPMTALRANMLLQVPRLLCGTSSQLKRRVERLMRKLRLLEGSIVYTRFLRCEATHLVSTDLLACRICSAWGVLAQVSTQEPLFKPARPSPTDRLRGSGAGTTQTGSQTAGAARCFPTRKARMPNQLQYVFAYFWGRTDSSSSSARPTRAAVRSSYPDTRTDPRFRRETIKGAGRASAKSVKCEELTPHT
eukprot:scaffold39490_cov63-Phaeocystis_antarctica.AAC.1